MGEITIRQPQVLLAFFVHLLRLSRSAELYHRLGANTLGDGRLGPDILREASLQDGEVVRELVRSVECAHMSE